MSYMDVTKKEAKKLFSLLKGRSKEELFNLSYDDAKNILAISKGFTGYEHFKRETEEPIINNENYKNSMFKFTKEDVLNDIYPEFTDTLVNKINYPINDDISITHSPLFFIDKDIDSFSDRVVLFAENEPNCLSKKIIESIQGSLIIGQKLPNSILSLKKDITVSVHKRYNQYTIDPLNPLISNKEALKRLFSHQTLGWLFFHLNNNQNNGEKQKLLLKSFKGFFNLNYLIKSEDYYTRQYLLSIGIGDDNIITEQAINKHILYSRQGLIFAQIMIDYPFCFSEFPSFIPGRNFNNLNVLIELNEPLKEYQADKESLYEASKILKNTIFQYLYGNFYKKCPYALIALFNIDSKDYKLRNTILINNIEQLDHVKTAPFNEAVLDKPKDSENLYSQDLKRFILSSRKYQNFIDLPTEEKFYISIDGKFKKINKSKIS